MQEEKDTIMISIAITCVFIFILISFIAFIIFIHHRRQIAHKRGIETLKSNFERTLLSTQLEIQEQTFQNISREIHDNIGLSLTLAKLNLNTIHWNHIVQTKEKVSSSVDFISKAIEDLSYISKTLHTDYIEENGLLNALDLEIKKISKLGIYSIEYSVIGSPVYMKTQKELVIFRIIQEVLNNSIKHAQATTMGLELNYLQDRVEVKLFDNGKGFINEGSGQETKKGTGLMNIIKRASFIEGICEIKSEPGIGTVIFMQIPY
jgi:two-component system, NarL family, sensor kinase